MKATFQQRLERSECLYPAGYRGGARGALGAVAGVPVRAGHPLRVPRAHHALLPGLQRQQRLHPR